MPRELVALDQCGSRARRSPKNRLAVLRERGSHRALAREGWPNYVFAFHDGEELSGAKRNVFRRRSWRRPRMLARIAKHTGLRPEDL